MIQDISTLNVRMSEWLQNELVLLERVSIMETSARVAERMIFRGRVQGVGFRVMALEVAQNYALTGYVRNLPDGTVELLAQGETASLGEFLEALTERFRANIQGVERIPVPLDDGRQRFEIWK